MARIAEAKKRKTPPTRSHWQPLTLGYGPGLNFAASCGMFRFVEVPATICPAAPIPATTVLLVVVVDGRTS
jgi:hypothetical protein